MDIVSRENEISPKEFHWVMNSKNFMIFQVKCCFKVLLLDVGDVSVYNYCPNG